MDRPTGDRWVVNRGPRWDGRSGSWHNDGHVYENVPPGEAWLYATHCKKLPAEQPGDRGIPAPETGMKPPETRPTPNTREPGSRPPREQRGKKGVHKPPADEKG